MKKNELIWREILETGTKQPNLPAGRQVFQQLAIAKKLDLSTSTVFAAIKPLREIGAITVTGRNFTITNFEKILLFWASHRHLAQDIIYQTRVNEPTMEIEGLIDNKSVYGAYSAGKFLLGTAPAEYDKVYVYGPESLKARFPKLPGPPNLFILPPDPFLSGKTTPVSQTFVDLWNLSDWYAADFITALKEKFYAGILQ